MGPRHHSSRRVWSGKTPSDISVNGLRPFSSGAKIALRAMLVSYAKLGIQGFCKSPGDLSRISPLISPGLSSVEYTSAGILKNMALKPIGLSVLLAFPLGGALQADNNEINWLGDYREGLRLARQTQKPLLVEFRCEA